MKLIGFGEIMMRMSSNSFYKDSSLECFIGGAEYNVIANLASMKIETAFISSIPENILGEKVLEHANSYGIDVTKIKMEGEKLGTYYSFIGSDYVPTSVIYDRRYSSFYFSNKFDFGEALKGYDILHVSGVTPAINENVRQIAYELIKEAHEAGIKVSYDSNFRGKMWTQKEAGEFLKLILPLCDIVFLGILDLQFLLNYNCVDLEDGYKKLLFDYPNIKLVSSTSREIFSQNHQSIQGNIYNGELIKSRKYDMNIVDRIGTGDSFTAGVLYGVINSLSIQETINFAMANGVIKHHVIGDNYKANIKDINNLAQNIKGVINR